MNFRKLLAMATALLAALLLQQQAAAQQGGMGHGGMSQPGDAMAEGVVRKVDKDAGKLTIKHGPIPSMDMPPMTMVYRVSDPAMLDQVKPGDAIRFAMEKVGGQYTVTRIGAGR